MSKVVLITGTSSGLGAGLAIAAAKQGHVVFATMRDINKRAALDGMAKAANTSLHVLALDTQSNESVNAAVSVIIAQQGHIDTVVNNAGMGFARATEQASLEDISKVMDVNFMGVVRVTKAVLPHMRAAASGHFINISSVGGLVGQPFNEVYCASKFAVEGYTEALASYVQQAFNIHFTLVEPGGIKSEFLNNAMKQINETGGLLQDAYLPTLQKYMGGIQKRGTSSFQTIDEVVEVVMACMKSPSPPLRIRTSAWAEDFASFKTSMDPDGTQLRDKVFKTFLGD